MSLKSLYHFIKTLQRDQFIAMNIKQKMKVKMQQITINNFLNQTL